MMMISMVDSCIKTDFGVNCQNRFSIFDFVSKNFNDFGDVVIFLKKHRISVVFQNLKSRDFQ